MKRVATVPDMEMAVLFRKAADFCAVQDRCLSDMRQKLQDWGCNREQTESILNRLTGEGFIDEQRYARAYARGKFRNLHWGKIKIITELQRKNLSRSLILNAVAEIDPDEYRETIAKLLKKKAEELRSDTVENRYKVMRFLAGKGFEPEMIRKLMKDDI